MGGRRARVLAKCSQRAVEGRGERARRLGGNQYKGHRVTAALGFGVLVVVACLTDPAGACGATPRAIGLRAPLWHSEVGDDEGFLSVAQYGEAPAVRRGGGAALVRRAEAEGGGDVEGGVAFKLVAVWLDAKPDKVRPQEDL